MENVNKTFIKRVLTASERLLKKKHSSRPPHFRIPTNIMKRQMITDISNTAQRIRRFLSPSSSPEPETQLPFQSLTAQEDHDVDKDTHVFDLMDAQIPAQNNNDLNEAAAIANAKDEHKELDAGNQEELTSDDDDEEIMSFIRFQEDEEQNSGDEDVLTWLEKVDFKKDTAGSADTADHQHNQQQQYQQHKAPLTDVSNSQQGISAGSSTVIDEQQPSTIIDEQQPSTVIDEQQQLSLSKPDVSNLQDNTTDEFAWLSRLDSQNIITANTDQGKDQQQQLALLTSNTNNSQEFAPLDWTWLAELDSQNLLATNVTATTHTCNGSCFPWCSLLLLPRPEGSESVSSYLQRAQDQEQPSSLPAYKPRNPQVNGSTALSWLANLNPESVTAADLTQLLLTQTSELTSSEKHVPEASSLPSPVSPPSPSKRSFDHIEHSTETIYGNANKRQAH